MTLAEPPLWALARFLVASGLANLVLVTLLEGSQGLRISRLSLPFLLGSAFTGDRRRAMVLGVVIYLVGGLLFAGAYWVAFAVTGWTRWWAGALLGGMHGLFLMTAIMPVLPFIHPRMASEHAGPANAHGIEPPGFLALNYGYATPLMTMLAHALYGAILAGIYATE